MHVMPLPSTRTRPAALLCLALVVIVVAGCSRTPEAGVPGGQAGVRQLGPAKPPEPIAIVQDGAPQRMLRWEELAAIPEQEFSTGLEDVQRGYPLAEVVRAVAVTEPGAVTLHGVGLRPVTLTWTEVAAPDNHVLLGVTHKGTAKVVAGNPALLNRDGWIRHLTKIELHATLPPNAIRPTAEPSNPLHPRKGGQTK
jgi:hypothetical protein